MDTISYLLGKKKGGGGGGANLEDYFGTTIVEGTSNNCGIALNIKKIPDNMVASGTSLSNAFKYMTSLEVLPKIDYANVANARFMCYGCTGLKTIEFSDTSKVNNFQSAFLDCTNLENVPQFDLGNCSNITSMFSGCVKLTNNSLNNIMGSIASLPTTYGQTKTLYAVFNGNMSQYYPVSIIQSLSNYQAFIDKGWTIGWN